MQYLIHIGYPKAASSLLQSTIFSGQDPYIKPLNKNGKPYIGYQKSGGRVFFNKRAGYISYLDPFLYDDKCAVEAIRQEEDKEAQVTCLSNELWAGHPFSGGVTAKEYADRLYKTLPEAKILIVVRNQVDMIFSSYVHYIVKSRGCCSIDHFLSNNQHMQIPFHNLSYYSYDRLVEYYSTLFGKDRVLVLPFELLPKEGQKAFFKPIYNFLDIQSNIDVSSFEKNESDYRKYIILKKLKFLSILSSEGAIHSYKISKLFFISSVILKIFSKFISNRSVVISLKNDKAIIKGYIDDEIKKSNVELQKYVSQDLKSLGYILD